MFKFHKMIVRLKELELEKFRCFNSKATIKFEKLTIITGANSSGKSSILHAIAGLSQSSEMPVKFSLNGKYTNMGDFNEISNKHNPSNLITIATKFNSQDIDYSLKTVWKRDNTNYLPELNELDFSAPFFRLHIKDKLLNFNYNPDLDPLATEESRKDFFERSIASFNMNNNTKKIPAEKRAKELVKFKKFLTEFYKKTYVRNLKLSSLSNADTVRAEISKKMNFRLDYFSNALLSKLIEDFDYRFNLISSFRLYPNRTYLEASRDKSKVDKFGDGYLDQIMIWEKTNNPKLKELEKHLKEIGILTSLSSKRIGGGRYELQLKINDKGVLSALADVGFGVSQFLPIMVADLQLPKGSTLMIAEPEIHLHPNIQAKFGDYIVEQVEKKDKNYIIETHSEYFLNRLRLAIVKEELQEKNLCVYYLENDGQDVKIHNLVFTKNGAIKNAPKSFFETYMTDLKKIALEVKI